MQRRTFLSGAVGLTGAMGLAAASASCATPPPPQTSTPAAVFDAALQRVQVELLSHEPEQATILGFSPADAGLDAAARWGAYGLLGRTARRARLEAVGAALRPFKPEDLDPVRARLRRVLLERSEGWLALEKAAGQGHLSPWGVIWGYELYPINQISGLHIGAPNLLINYHAVETTADADAYIARLETLGAALDGVIEETRADAAIAPPPRAVVEGAQAIVAAFLESSAADHPVVASYRARLAAAGLAGRYGDHAERAMRTHVQPAYQRLAAALAEIAPRAGDALGLHGRANGEEVYRLALRMQADTSLSPEEIHAIGLAETDRLARELGAACDQMGLPKGPLQDRLDALRTLPGQLYDNSDAGRAALLKDLADLVADADRRILSVFERAPQRAPVITRVPPFLEAFASGGGGQPPSLDGRKPGVYVINLKDMDNVARWSLPALTFHEATPGHIYEGEIAMSGGHPALQLFLARSNGFAEGWAMYAEKLAGELGLYEGRPGAEIGRLRSEMFRAARLVVDTGLHHYGWSQERAVAYMVNSGASRAPEARREIVRYAAWPGQAVGYKLGMRAIESARSQMQARDGAGFSIKRFHAAALATGGVPIPELLAAIATATP
ncbi:MAG: DUF885 family protein [Alphaproteobacteria bacterium]|nr:DUF885 family protein [Alphaproteobacteria bacterium]